MVKEKVLDYANKISRTKRGAKDEITPNRPEYYILEPVVSEEMAEVGLCLGLREPKSAKEVAVLSGKSEEKVAELLWELAMTGAAFVNKIDGVDKYWHDIWVPGHMEMMVNHKENVKKYPQIARAFDEYGKLKGPVAAGMFPVGVGPMRVIPIEKAISGETRKASYEEVSKYLNENTLFSVSDCSCRTSREALGEGCGHLKEDMCIQMGHAAEYYIRTGRGREITRDEAFEIIKRAEENGLMHNIPNTDGPGHTHAICNCCGCGCFAMRIANMFVNPDMVRSNYVSQVDREKCVACGECVEACPTNASRLGSKLCSRNEKPEKKRELPYDTEWGADKFNPDYRTNSKVVVDGGSSPCKAECPAHIGIQGYVKLAAQGKYRDALELIKTENPFPAVCGRICPRYCESACTRGEVDDPLAIDDIKKFIAEQDLKEAHRFVPKKRHEYGKKIAIIGGGPAGLSCAYYLGIDGYQVTVFEKEGIPGGMLLKGIPAFRLEKNIIQSEIEVLRELGVQIKTGIEIGKDKTIEELRKEGFEAFYLAVGAQAGRKLGLDGEDAAGIMTGVDFLRRVNFGELKETKGKIVVIGGGNVAIDVARTAKRTGAESIEMFCLEGRTEMPALEEEVVEALEESIQIQNGWGPKKIHVKDGQLVGVEFRKCTRVFDESGRFAPVYDENQTCYVEANHLLISVGQSIYWGDLLKNTKIALRPNQTVIADDVTYQTGEKDIFVGGDVYTGPRFAIDAIAMGKEGAISIHRFVQKGQSLTFGRMQRAYRAFDKENLELGGYDHIPRQKAATKETYEADFHDHRGILSEEQMKKETERCLGCGATVVDEFLCVGCGACTTKCKFDAIHLVRRYDRPSVDLKDMKTVVMKYAIKRKVRIAVKKPIRAVSRLFKS